METLQQLRAIARPVVFETGVDDYPIGIAGTATLVGYRAGAFVLTAKHVIKDHPIHRVVIWPSAGSRARLPLPQAWTALDSSEDVDRTDLLVMRGDIAQLRRRILKSARLLHLTPQVVTKWFGDRFSSTFMVFGFPKSHNGVNYEAKTVEMGQVFLKGRYIGPSHGDDCHIAEFENPLGAGFDGLSGSPVFAVANALGPLPAPKFCGIAIRGSSASNRIHFVGASMVLHMLDQIVDNNISLG